MGVSAAVAVGGAIISSRASSKASGKAARAQAEGTASEIAELRRQFDLTRADLAPAREAQEFALERLMSLIQDPSQVSDLPGFAFRLEQGAAAREESAAAAGGLFSGNTLQALEEFGQQFATAEVNQEFNRLSTLAGLGAGGVNQGVATGGALSSQIAGAFGAGGAQQAGAFLREGNIQEDLINSIATNAAFAGRLRDLRPGTPPFVPGGRGPQFTGRGAEGLIGSGNF